MLKKKYKRLLGSSRGGHFREPKKRFQFSTRRRQSVRFRGRYAKSVVQGAAGVLWRLTQVLFVVGTLVWSSALGLHFFRESTLFKINKVVYRGDVPAQISSVVPKMSGLNIFSVTPAKIEQEIYQRFPQVKHVSVYRTLGRNVVIKLELRIPVAFADKKGKIEGVDESGEIFPIENDNGLASDHRPLLKGGDREDRKKLVEILGEWEKEAPKFYALVRSVETDRNLGLAVELTEPVKIHWGAFDEKNVIEKAQNVLRLRELYAPDRFPATLRFVDKDRIVMDSHWIKTALK